MRTLRQRQVLPSSWISVSHVARPGLLDAASIGGRRSSAENRLQTGRSPRGEHPHRHGQTGIPRGRPRAVDRGEQRSRRRPAQQGVALVQRLVREHAVDEEPVDVRAVSEDSAGFLGQQAPAQRGRHALTLAGGRASRPICIPAGLGPLQPNETRGTPQASGGPVDSSASITPEPSRKTSSSSLICG